MDHMASSRKSHFDIDLESGGEAETTTEDEENGNHDDQKSVSGIRHPKKILSRLSSGHISRDRSTKCSDGLGRIKNVVINFDENVVQRPEDNFWDHDRKIMKEKRKKSTSKHPKPPRPPGRPSVDAADVKFVNKIFELARLRRANKERLSALKKMKANSKASSSNINLIAMVITVIFCLVMIFQGFLGSRA